MCHSVLPQSNSGRSIEHHNNGQDLQLQKSQVYGRQSTQLDYPDTVITTPLVYASQEFMLQQPKASGNVGSNANSSLTGIVFK